MRRVGFLSAAGKSVRTMWRIVAQTRDVSHPIGVYRLACCQDGSLLCWWYVAFLYVFLHGVQDPMWLQVGLMLILVGVSGLLVSEWHPYRRLRGTAKTMASAGFLSVAFSSFPWPELWQFGLVSGLLLGACGDVFLLSERKKSFLFGLTSFLLGHLCYGFAFSRFPLSVGDSVVWCVVVALLFFGVARWAWPYLHNMRGPVVLYMGVLGTTLVMGLGAAAPRHAVWGMVLFAASDIFVLRQRFVRAERRNRCVGLPLYYAGQSLVAWSLGT